VTPAMDPAPGDRVRLCLGDGSRLRARVTACVGTQLELVLAATSRPVESRLVANDPVEICLYHADAVYVHRASFRSRLPEGALAVLLDGAPPQRLQRREYFRMPVRFSFLVRLRGRRRPTESMTPMLEDPSIPSAPTQWALFSLVNLSGGGCLLLDPEGLLKPDTVYEGRLHTGDDQPPLVLQSAVVRRTQFRGGPAAGLRFVALKEKDRQRIIAALFREYRRIMARRRQRALAHASGPSPEQAD
jgi:c-di-GMP-binding flagellar brake protein YcgR